MRLTTEAYKGIEWECVVEKTEDDIYVTWIIYFPEKTRYYLKRNWGVDNVKQAIDEMYSN
jgi:hypothetical protein|tara:strand:- start:241 stop:420 length:180 start_codon:yes stop_codon:yes gene_type:complete